MFCHKCGKELDNSGNFCHNCGTDRQKIVHIFGENNESKEKETAIPTKIAVSVIKKIEQRETREEYMARTDIKSVDEAKEYLSRLRVLFVTMLAGVIIMNVMENISEYENVYGLLVYPYIALVVYFIYFCVKVKKAEKIVKTSVVWSVLFAPISWIWFYPAITEPLKIIVGEKSLPTNFSSGPSVVNYKIIEKVK